MTDLELLTVQNDQLQVLNARLAAQNDKLRDQLADAILIGPYDSAGDAYATLTCRLPGWPTARWRELAHLILQGNDR